MGTHGLDTYLAKRDFARTPEPTGGEPSGDEPVFVVQQHDASSMHWDLRLEIGGVLVSWAVPKGPSTDPREKRLAVRTEDHPMDYASFEGDIPEDEYGGGSVIVWDAGPYTNITAGDDGEVRPIEDALASGSLQVWLHGEKLEGGYRLVHARVGGGERNWLLEKLDDAGADARRNPTSTQPESVLTGRTVEDVAAGGEGP